MSTLPVSIIIPCRNEESFIGRCLDSVLANDYPNDGLEVLVVDGMSEDDTRLIVERYVNRHNFLKLLDNPSKITPVGLNIGINSAKGTVIIRMDAHSEYPPTYISTCIQYLDKTGADVVGGPIITKPSSRTFAATSIALATSHPFGVGNSRFRTSLTDGYVDTVPFGAYKREVFDRVGLFNEKLVRNQDNELSSHIAAGGGKIYLTSHLTVTYYNQVMLMGLLRQALRTGMWNIVTWKANPTAFRLRHFAPFAFVAVLLALVPLSLLSPGVRLTLLTLVGLYGSLAVLSSFSIGLKAGIRYVPFLPLVFFLYHISYGVGSLLGVFRVCWIELRGKSAA